MMKMTGLSYLFKWENLHNWWLTKYFFAPLYIYVCVCAVIQHTALLSHSKLPQGKFLHRDSPRYIYIYIYSLVYIYIPGYIYIYI